MSPLTRRSFISQTTGLSLSSLAAATLLQRDLQAAESTEPIVGARALPGLPHHEPRVKRVIWLMQSGAPSHCDLFDYKPLLAQLRGEEIPESIHKGQKLSTMTQGRSKPCLGPRAPFRQHGESGRWISDFLPHTA